LAASIPVAELGIPIVGIPKTIDNDVVETDTCIGFDTALSIATEAVDRVHTTAESHDRTIVLELMGRSTGWLAAGAGLASGAEVVVVPERSLSFDRTVEALERRHRGGACYSIVVVAEGVRLVDGQLTPASPDMPAAAASIGPTLAGALQAATGFETRCTVLGHVQRGGPATSADRLLGTKFGVAAVDAAHRGCTSNLVAACGSELRVTRLPTKADGVRAVPPSVLHLLDILTIV
jgi:6-phosphofructokinase 1